MESNTSSSLVGERGRSLEGGSFTLLSLPTGDDASRSGDGDRDLDRRDPRLTTESSRAMSAAHESQSILAARGGGAAALVAHAAVVRLPFSASRGRVSPMAKCEASRRLPLGVCAAPRGP